MKTMMAVALACTATMAAAQDKPATEKRATEKPRADPDKRICQTSGDTGSRLAVRRECHTMAEWDQIRTENGDTLRRVTSPR